MCETILVKTIDHKEIRINVFTVEELRDVECTFILSLIDSLQTAEVAIRRKGNNTAMVRGELGEYLREQAKVYDTLLKAATVI